MPAAAHLDVAADAGSSRAAAATFDDLGVTLRGAFRLTGVSSDVRGLLKAASEDQIGKLIERGLDIGLSTIASAGAIDASSLVHQRLADAADQVTDAVRDLQSRQNDRDQRFETAIRTTIGSLKATLSEASDEGQRSQQLLRAHADDISKAARALDMSRVELETRTVQAAKDLADAQSASTSRLLADVDGMLRKLVNPEDPGSAAAIINGLLVRATTGLRTSTDAHLSEMAGRLTCMLGPDSQFAQRLIAACREDAERSDRRVLEQLDKLREMLIVSNVRQEHDPTIKGESYEEKLCALLEPVATAYAMTVHGTGRDTGEQAGSKKGDVLLADETMTAKIAIEARARRGVSMRAAIDEMTGTATNRGVKVVAYLVPGREYLPSGASEFSRGGMPFSYKRLPGDVHAMIAVIDPDDVMVAERVAVLVWLLDRMSASIVGPQMQENLADRVTGALAYAEQAVQHLSLFRQIKANLTGASSQIDKARENVDGAQRILEADLSSMQNQLGSPSSSQ